MVVAGAVAAPGADFGSVVRLQVTLIAALLLPMTVAFGAAFPLAVALAARTDDSVAADVSLVYAANTLGAIAGALAGGFWLVPALGLEGSVRAAAGLATAGFVVVAAAYAATFAQKAMAVGAAGAAAGAIWLLPHWDRALVSSGAYKYAALLPDEHREALLGAGTLLYYREGAASTVSVRRTAGVTMLAIDGKVDASNGGDMLTQRLLAHLPLLLHEAPRRVGIIGLGSGVTLASALRHPVERVDVIEISPEVVDASAFFVRENRDALRDPRARLVVGDGRTHLALGRETYDVLISEPSNPWMAGIAALFTREFFEAAKSRLAPGGLLCQWAHTYDIRDADLRSIVATFSAVFPDVMLFLVGEGDVLLVGSREPLGPRLDVVRAAWARPGVAPDLGDVEVNSPDVLISLAAGARADLERYSSGAVLQRDDRLSLEFSGPRGLYGEASDGAARMLRSELGRSALPPAVTKARGAPEFASARGAMLLRAEAASEAFDEFARAIGHDARHQQAADGLLRSAAQAGRVDEAERVLRRTLQADPQSLEAAIALSRLRASLGDFAGATEPLREEMGRARSDPRALEQLASVAADAEDSSEAHQPRQRARAVGARRRRDALLRGSAPRDDGSHRGGLARGRNARPERRSSRALPESRRRAVLGSGSPRRGEARVCGRDRSRPARSDRLHEPRRVRDAGRQRHRGRAALRGGAHAGPNISRRETGAGAGERTSEVGNHLRGRHFTYVLICCRSFIAPDSIRSSFLLLVAARAAA